MEKSSSASVARGLPGPLIYVARRRQPTERPVCVAGGALRVVDGSTTPLHSLRHVAFVGGVCHDEAITASSMFEWSFTQRGRTAITP